MSNILPILIAEIGSVHDGSFGNALNLIEGAAKAGADAVKFQTHLAEFETLANAPAPAYFQDEPRMEYFRRTGFSISQWKRLAAHASKCGVTFLSSPFSLEAVDLLEEVGISHYKIPSGEVSNLPLLERIAETGKPCLLSSGMSDWKDLDAAIEALRGSSDITILQCSSAYPCAPEAVGLNVIGEMKARYGLKVGFSDHTLGYAAPFAAAALGATVIEKHFTFSRLMYGSDAKHSMEPDEFRILSSGLKEIWRMLGNPVDKNSSDSYREMKQIFEKSVVTRAPIDEGTVLTKGHLAFKKPGTGIRAADYARLIGRKIRRALPGDHLIEEGDLA